MPQRTASTTLRNSTKTPSPVRFTTRPLWTAIVGSTRSLRRARSLANVRSSSAPASRLNPTTSAARIAASFRDSVMSVPQVSRRNPSAREVLNLTSRAGLSSRMGSSVPSRSFPPRTPPAAWPARAIFGLDATTRCARPRATPAKPCSGRRGVRLTLEERDRLVERRPARTGLIDRHVLVPDRHAAVEDEILPGRQHLRDRLAIHRPRHLRATVQSFGAEQQHDRLQVHADVGPLWPAHAAVDVEEQADGRAEKLPVRGGGPLARLQVPARDAERAVALRAEGRLALAVRGRQRGGIHLVLPLVPRVARGHALAGEPLELGQRCAGQHVDVPRLDVRSGRRPSRRG